MISSNNKKLIMTRNKWIKILFINKV